MYQSMASGEIRISAEEMNSRAQQYDAEAEKVEEIIGEMDQLLLELQEEWKGAASEAYAVKYEELKQKSFQEMQALIGDIATALRATAESMTSADDQIAQKFQ